MDELNQRTAQSLRAAMKFQERVLAVLNVGLDHLSTREQQLLDACMQVYLEDRARGRGAS